MLAKLKFYNAWTRWYLLVSSCCVVFSCDHTSIFLISLMYPRVRVHGLPSGTMKFWTVLYWLMNSTLLIRLQGFFRKLNPYLGRVWDCKLGFHLFIESQIWFSGRFSYPLCYEVQKIRSRFCNFTNQGIEGFKSKVGLFCYRMLLKLAALSCYLFCNVPSL